jgi:hypothetical protein
MKIDGNELEKKALEYARKGKRAEFSKCQDEFLAQVKASGEDHCNCPVACKYHGKCMECVLIHRGHEDHLPACFFGMVNRRLASMCGLTETRPAKPKSE